MVGETGHGSASAQRPRVSGSPPGGAVAGTRLVPLRFRLFLLTAAVLVPLAFMAWLALGALATEQRRQGERTVTDLARALSTGVDGEIARSLIALETLGASTLLDDTDLRPLYELAERIRSAHPHWRAMVLHDFQGRPVFSTRFPFGTRDISTVEPESLARAIETGRPVVGRLAKGPAGEWAFAVRLPVTRTRSARFVLSAIVAPDQFREVMARQRLPDDWVVSVFDSSRQRVARSRSMQHIGAAPSESLRFLMSRTANEGAGMTETLEGDRVYSAFSRSPETGWTVAVGMPAALIDDGPHQSLVVYGGGILLSIGLGVVAALIIAQGITRPMAELRVAAAALGRGEALRPPSTRIREIRDVGDSLAVAATERAASDREREDLLAREQQARGVAETANRAKDEFLAMLGHELRNPLGAIANASRLLDHPAVDATTAQQARGIVRRQVDHLTRMTDDLLDAARAMSGKIVLKREPLNLAAVIADVVAARRFVPTVVTQLDPVWVSADMTRFTQMLDNLLSNACKYTPDDGRITVSVRREAEEAVVEVRDTGMGLAPDLLPRVFEPFVQGNRGLDRAHGGLGIGLTLVRRLAELHGGSASAASAGPGQGSVFTLRLPALAAAAVPSPAAAVASRRSRDRRILLVEDNVDARASLSRLLELEGHHVHAVGTAEEALAVLADAAPDLALIDLGLPGIDGYELARRIRAQGPTTAAAPLLVALTGYGLPEDRRRSRAAGFHRHLIKPVDPVELARLLAGC